MFIGFKVFIGFGVTWSYTPEFTPAWTYYKVMSYMYNEANITSHVKSWLLVSTTINPTQPTNYVMFNFENMFIAYVFSSIYNSKLNRLLKLSFHNKGRLSMNLSKILLMVSKSSQKTQKLPSWTSAKESCRKLLLRKLWIVQCFHTPSPISWWHWLNIRICNL